MILWNTAILFLVRLIIPGIRRNSFKCHAIIVVVFLISSTPTYEWSLAKLNFWSRQTVEESVPSGTIDLKARHSPSVLNFFPVPVEEECLSQDKRRRGICMNTYECRIQNGKSHGPCALGFGVCCIFTASCNGEVQNNLTYVMNPDFPNLIDQPMNCSVTVQRIDAQITQLRIDFIHFNIGQPNRNGVCDEDVMEIKNGNRTVLRLCGWNSGQHVYLDTNEDKEPVTLNFVLPNGLHSRMWEMRVIQLGFEERGPAGCLQYFPSEKGTLKTFNYLPNGRYLADQDYLLCVRQERSMCGIAYTPCTRNSFRIGSSKFQNVSNNDAKGVDTSSFNSTDVKESLNSTNDNIEVEGSGADPADQQVASATTNALTERRCVDRVLIPCDFEEFITPGNDGIGICNLEHCGDSLCKENELDADGNCRIETWATPFRIRVSFGPERGIESILEDNIGMCLMYEQLPCIP